MAKMNAKKATDNAKDTKICPKKVEDLASENWYIAKIAQATQKPRQIELWLSMFNKTNPDKQYRTLRMWLDKEYYDGDLTDLFFSLFPEVDTINKLRGKEFMVYVEYVTSSDGENEYLRVTDIAAME